MPGNMIDRIAGIPEQTNASIKVLGLMADKQGNNGIKTNK